MRKLTVSAATAAIAVIGMLVMTPAGAEPAAKRDVVGPAHAPCGTPGPNRENRVDADAPLAGAANQRSGTRTVSAIDCVILGVLQPTDDALYHCWTLGADRMTWTYLRNLRTNVSGWVRDDLLDGAGSNVHCGF